MASENDDNSRRDHSRRLETVIEAHRRSAGEADALIESLVSPSWGVSEGPHDNTADPLYATADRLLAQLPGGLAAVGPPPAPKRQGRDLRRVVLRRGVQLLSVGLVRLAWCRLKAAVHQRARQIRGVRSTIAVHRSYWTRRQAAAFRLWDTSKGKLQPQIEAAHEWKQKAGGLRIMAVLKFNARYRLGNSMERWRESIGGGYVSRAMHQAIIQEHATKVLELETSLADLRVLSEEREWLSSVLTKQLVREEDKANKLQKELSDLETQQRLLRAEVAVPQEPGSEVGAPGTRKRPSRLALEAVFSSASPLPAGAMQLLSHLEGETEAAGVLLGRESQAQVQQQPHVQAQAQQQAVQVPQVPQDQQQQQMQQMQLQAGFAAGWAAAHSSLTEKAGLPSQPPTPLQLEVPTPSHHREAPHSPQPPPSASSPLPMQPTEPHTDRRSIIPQPPSRHEDYRTSTSGWSEQLEPTRLGHTFNASFGAPMSSMSAFESPAPTPSAALRKLSDATVVAKQIASDAPTQALFATYAEPLRSLFGRFASKRVQGELLLSENGWLRLTKSVGLSPSLVSSKSLRHFAMCTGGADAALSFPQFLTGLGLCAIYVHRSHQDAWSLREKVLTLFAGFKNCPAIAAVPSQCVGPRVEGFLWRLFDHFSSASSATSRQKGPKSLSNWGWAKLVRELKVSHCDAHPDVMFGRHATRGKLSFEAFVHAMTDLDRLIAHDRNGGLKGGTIIPGSASARRSPPLSPRPHNQENAAPLTNVLSEVTSTTGFLASAVARGR